MKDMVAAGLTLLLRGARGSGERNLRKWVRRVIPWCVSSRLGVGLASAPSDLQRRLCGDIYPLTLDAWAVFLSCTHETREKREERREWTFCHF